MKTIETIAEEIQEQYEGGASVSDVMHILRQWIAPLQHHYDTTVGLWCTDRPDLISDPQNIMFQLTTDELCVMKDAEK